MPAAADLTLAWDDLKPRDWARLQGSGRSVLEQAHGYGEAVAAASRYRIRRAAIRRGREVIAVAQVFRRDFGPLHLVRQMRGPHFAADVDAATRAEVYARLARQFSWRRGEVHFWMPELEDGADARALMAGLGKRRMVTGYASIWLDLRQDEAALRADLDRRFRRSLGKATAARLKIDIGHGGGNLDWLLTEHDAHRRQRRLVAPSGDLARAIAGAQPNARDTLVVQATTGSTPIAGMMFLRHGDAATYYVGVTTPAGRLANAHHLTMWRGVMALREQGVAWLDLGGLNTDTMPGVAGFKLGLGGRLFTLAGTFL